MRNTVINSDFIVESKGRCFFCLDKIVPQGSSINSLQCLSRFLRMDMRRVFTDCQNGDIPPHLLAKVERSTLRAQLCQRCCSANETLSKLCRRLEKIEMEVMNSLEHIYRRLLETEAITSELEEPTDTMEESGHEWIAKLGILHVLRKDAIHKCSDKLKAITPKLKLQCLTERDVVKEKRKFIHSSRKSFNKKSNLNRSNDNTGSNSQYLSDDVTHETIISPAGIKTEFDESFHMDLDSDDLHFDIETASLSPSGIPSSQVPVKRESDAGQSSDMNKVPQHRRKQGRTGPKISDNIERIKSGGLLSSRTKFRCKICTMMFSKQCNIIRHIKAIHLKKREFRCTYCSKEFAQKINLETHMSLHSGIMPHKCHICPKGYFRKDRLRRHLLIHSRPGFHTRKPQQ